MVGLVKPRAIHQVVVTGSIVLGLSAGPVLRCFCQVQMHDALTAHRGQVVWVIVRNITTKTGRWNTGFLVTLEVGDQLFEFALTELLANNLALENTDHSEKDPNCSSVAFSSNFSPFSVISLKRSAVGRKRPSNVSCCWLCRRINSNVSYASAPMT